ncbi:sensor histidine kinase [Pseudoduganella sp. HUAS MS19]
MKREHYFCLLQLAGWAGVALFVALVNRLEIILFPISAWCGLSGLVLSSAWRHLCNARLQRGKRLTWPVAVGAALLLGSIQTLSNLEMDKLLTGPGWKGGGLPWKLILLSFWVGVMLAWNVCYMAALSLRRNQRLEAEALLLEAEALRFEVLAKDAELRALQAQVNPHFFFNSLNSVRALLYQDIDSAANMIDQLATLMRYTLVSSYNDCVPLADELAAVRAYLAIEKIRFEERLQFAIDIDQDMEAITVPPMALQTLVENAVKYGVEQSSIGSAISIRARSAGSTAIIEVANRGDMLPGGKSTGVGVSNARKRLALSKGEHARLDLDEHDGWVRATLRFPIAA